MRLLLTLTALFSMNSFAAEVCIIDKEIPFTSSNGVGKYTATATCSGDIEQLFQGSDSSSPLKAKALLVKKLVERGYNPKTDEMFIYN